MPTRSIVFALTLAACGGTSDPAAVMPPDDGGTDDAATSDTPDLATTTKDLAAPPKGSPDLACAAVTYYRDQDSDGYGDPAHTMSACSAPSGYVANMTDCNDAVSSVHPGATEVCNLVDDNCDGTIDGAGCASFAHAYAGTYTMHTVEKLGSTVVNEVTCTGTSNLTIDLSASPVVKGTVTCHYAGSLGGFSSTENGTITAGVTPDGSVSGELKHQFDDADSSTARSFTFTGSISGGNLSISRDDASWLPNPQSAQPWDVDFSVAAH
jgi:hypothetical protein